MASSNSQIVKPQPGHPKRAELLDVNINTGAQALTLRELQALKGNIPGLGHPCCHVKCCDLSLCFE